METRFRKTHDMRQSIEAVPVVAMDRKRVESWHADKQNTAVPKRPGQLAQETQRLGDMFQHVVQNHEVKTSVLGRRV